MGGASAARWHIPFLLVRRLGNRVQGSLMSVAVHVGDPAMVPLTVRLGSVTVVSRDGESPVPPPPRSKFAAQFTTLPEITHLHRTAHQQPPAVVPFTAVALLLGVLAIWLLAGLPTAGKPAPGSDSPVHSMFLGLLAATLVFAVWFWWRLTLLDVLLPLGGLAVAMLVVGHASLASLADRRLARDDKRGKAE